MAFNPTTSVPNFILVGGPAQGSTGQQEGALGSRRVVQELRPASGAVPNYVGGSNELASATGRVLAKQNNHREITHVNSERALALQNNERAIVPQNSERAIVPQNSERAIVPQNSERAIVPVADESPLSAKVVDVKKKHNHRFGKKCSVHKEIKKLVKKHKGHSFTHKECKHNNKVEEVADKYNIAKGTKEYTKVEKLFKKLAK